MPVRSYAIRASPRQSVDVMASLSWATLAAKPLTCSGARCWQYLLLQRFRTHE